MKNTLMFKVPLGPGALGRSASIRAGIVWASFGASFKDCMLSAFPSISKNLTGQEFHGTAYHDPEDKTRRYNKQSYGRCQAWGHDFLGHRFGWGPHRFACLSHPCRVSGPFLINLIVLNSDGGSYISLPIFQHPPVGDVFYLLGVFDLSENHLFVGFSCSLFNDGKRITQRKKGHTVDG